MTLTTRRGPIRKVLLIMVSSTVVLGVLGYLFVPWRSWAGEPAIAIQSCGVDTEPRDETMPQGSATIDVTVTNWSWTERHYALKFTVTNASGEEVGHSDLSFVATVPPRSRLSGTHLIRLTGPGAVDCAVAEVKELEAAP